MQTDDSDNVGTHTIDLIATYPISGITATISFTIEIDSCLIQSTPAYTDEEYEIYEGSKTITLLGFTKNSATCPDFIYSAVKQGSASLPTGVTFDPATRTFTINSSDDNDAGVFTIEVTGIYTGGSLTKANDFKKATFKLTMLSCRVTAVA